MLRAFIFLPGNPDSRQRCNLREHRRSPYWSSEKLTEPHLDPTTTTAYHLVMIGFEDVLFWQHVCEIVCGVHTVLACQSRQDAYFDLRELVSSFAAHLRCDNLAFDNKCRDITLPLNQRPRLIKRCAGGTRQHLDGLSGSPVRVSGSSHKRGLQSPLCCATLRMLFAVTSPLVPSCSQSISTVNN